MRAGSLLLLAFLAACASPAPAPIAPQAETSCKPWARIRAAAPPQIQIIEVDGLPAFLKAFNSIPPESNVVAEQAFVAHLGSRARIFFVTAGCVTQLADVAWEDIAGLMGTES